MSDTQLPVSEYIKQGVFIIAILAICLFGIKTCRKFQHKKQILIELSSHSNESAAYEQFYPEGAQQNLLKAMFQIHSGVSLGVTPAELLDDIMNQQDSQFFSSEEPSELPIRKALIRDALLSNYDNCLKLGLFDNQLNLDALSKGEFPIISKGPTEGEEVLIQNIIPIPALAGADKLLPNMIISPPLSPEEKNSPELLPTEFEVARAKRLAQQLATAELIEKKAYRQVINYYENLAKTPLEETPGGE